MEIGNGSMPGFEIPDYKGDTVKAESGRQGNEGDLGHQFPQEDDEEEVLKGSQQIEGNGNFKKPDVHPIDPSPFPMA